MRIELASGLRKRSFVFASTALLFVAWLLCLQEAVQSWFLGKQDLNNLERAARIQPLNSQTQENIGLLSFYPPNDDVPSAISHLERAVALNPHSSHAWLSLANVYEITGEDDRRAAAIRQALAAEPRDTEVQWQAANLFINSDLDASLQLLREVIQHSEQYAPAAMQVAYSASQGNVEKAMLAIPQTTQSRLGLIKWLIGRQQYASADRVWPTVLTSEGNLTARDTFFYFDSLIERRQVQQASAVWSGLLGKDAVLRASTAPGSLVTNGDFESDLLNGGFGWRYVPTTGVTATLDTSTFHSGTRSLALQIDGENLAECGLTELIPVEPGAHYRLSAFMHADELEAARGIRLSISDAYSHSELLLTDEMVGSFPWREVGGAFDVPIGTDLVKIALMRSPSEGIIRGRLWVDDVRIEKR